MALGKPTGKLAFAYQSIAILEAARKQDDALIRQLLDALEQSSPHTDATFAWKPEAFVIKRSAAVAAAKARLGENT